ncbi:MAG: methyltransferase domain-containing protein [Anaerolineaceae bacterium]|nr:MAG: methyltransferase domain-containing protein [Anaerolineaceae bacterium]
MYQSIKQELRKTYDLSATDRDGRDISLWKQEERQSFLELIKKEQKTTLLEIGAGPGKDSKFFQDHGLQVISTDLSPQMVQMCRAKGLEAYVMDFLNLNFPDTHFDAVYALNCLLHVPKVELPAVLTAIHRILKPSGLFFMGVYGGYASEGIWQDDHLTPQRYFSLYPDDQIQAIVSNTFTVHDFKIVKLPESTRPDMHFQRLILRKL